MDPDLSCSIPQVFTGTEPLTTSPGKQFVKLFYQECRYLTLYLQDMYVRTQKEMIPPNGDINIQVVVTGTDRVCLQKVAISFTQI